MSDVMRVRADDLVLVQGIDPTRATLRRWTRKPSAVLTPWLAGAVAVSVLLLVAVDVVAHNVTPDATRMLFPGLNEPSTLHGAGAVLFRNSLVLALHAMACVAGFIAGSELPREARRYGPRWRWVHDRAGHFAILFVAAATLFSLGTQAFVLGTGAATLSAQQGIPPELLLFMLLPHALPELVALFLPLAAWLIASRRDQWDELLAATVVTLAVSIPLLMLASLVETYVSGHLIRAVAG